MLQNQMLIDNLKNRTMNQIFELCYTMSKTQWFIKLHLTLSIQTKQSTINSLLKHGNYVIFQKSSIHKVKMF